MNHYVTWWVSQFCTASEHSQVEKGEGHWGVILIHQQKWQYFAGNRGGSNTKYSNNYPNKIQYLKYLKLFDQILFVKYYLVFGQILNNSTWANTIQILSITFFRCSERLREQTQRHCCAYCKYRDMHTPSKNDLWSEWPASQASLVSYDVFLSHIICGASFRVFWSLLAFYAWFSSQYR